MNQLTRRSFVSAAAALGMAVGATGAAEAQMIWKTTDWKLGEFETLAKNPARVKQLYDVVEIGGGTFLHNVMNALNGLEFGFGVPRSEIKIAVGMRGPANMLNFDDYVWNKYQVGAWLKVTDPETGKPALRNIYAGTDKAEEAGAQNPDDQHSMYHAQDRATLRRRGVQFMSCHNSLENQARELVKLRNLNEQPEEVFKDLLAHALPGTLVVAAMVAAIALLQVEGHYSYIKI